MELWLFFVACLIGGFILAMIGFSKFSDPFKSRKWFFIGSLTLLAPTVLALILLAIYENELYSSSPGITQFSFGLISFEVIVIAALLFGRFGFAEARATRNSTLGCSIFLFIQLIIGFLIVTMLWGVSEPTRWREYDKIYKDFGYMEVAGQIAISAYWGNDENVEIPSAIDGKSVTSIDNSAFAGNDSMATITIPESVTSLGDRAFIGYEKLKSIWVSPDNPVFSSDEGMLYNKEKTTLIICPAGKTGTVVLPDGVTSINEGAFTGSYLTSITIPEGVTSIGSDVFNNCNYLTSFTIPDSVTSVGFSAFTWCWGLNEITVSPGNPEYSSDAGILYNKDKTTLICCPPGKTGTVVLPVGVIKIDDFAFFRCGKLTSLTIPEGVTSIEGSTFHSCPALTNITIPDSVTSIEEGTFDDCDLVIIKCSENSYAHRYAVENEIEFVIEG